MNPDTPTPADAETPAAAAAPQPAAPETIAAPPETTAAAAETPAPEPVNVDQLWPVVRKALAVSTYTAKQRCAAWGPDRLARLQAALVPGLSADQADQVVRDLADVFDFELITAAEPVPAEQPESPAAEAADDVTPKKR